MGRTAILFWLLLPFGLAAQNYECVKPGQLALFNNGWDIRGIDIESETVGPQGETLFENYPAVEFNQVQQAFIGNSWIGAQAISNNGWNHFINASSDSIHVHVLADQDQSWEFYRFGPTKHVIAWVDTILEQSFIGLIDSVKVVRFETIENGMTTPGWIDAVQLRLSKNHGMVETINFYEFPEPYSDALYGLQLNWHYDDLIHNSTTDTTYTLHGLVTQSQTHGTGIMTPEEIYQILESLRFSQLHSVSEYYNGGEGGLWNTTFDHYVFHHDLTDSTSNVDAHTCYYNDWEVYTPTGTEYYESQGTIDTMSVIGNLNEVWYADRPYEITDLGGGLYRVAVRHINVDDRRVLSVMEDMVNTGGDTLKFGPNRKKSAYLEGLGQIYDYDYTSTGSGISLNSETDIWRLVYYRTWEQEWNFGNYQFHDTCMMQYIPVIVGLEENRSEEPSIYPNPSRGELNFQHGYNGLVRIVDMNGRTVFSGRAMSGKLNANLISGVYTVLTEESQTRVVIQD